MILHNKDNKNDQLTDLFGKLNSGEAPNDEFSSPDDEKMKFMWEDCMPEVLDPSSIINKTQQKIKRDALKRKRNYFLIVTTSIAASILLCIGAINLFEKQGIEDINFQAMVDQMEDQTVDEVTLITSKKQMNIDENSFVQYTKDGQVAVNSQSLMDDEEGVSATQAGAEEYNQLIVPAGKRARIQLSDGTHITLNAQSKIIYPRRFNGDVRKIYAQGEVFMDVAHDKTHPFIVESNGFNLQVLGTKFNISNYAGEATNIVLVEGSVEVTDSHNEKAKMVPNELLNISNGNIAYQKHVDVSEYISWMDGILLLKGKPLSGVVQSLRNYYGVSIHCDTELGKEKVYGKLDLKDNLNEVLESLRLALPFTVVKKESNIYLNK